MHLGEGPVLLSRSPELFFNVSADGKITTRPMKGTMPRGNSQAEDDEMVAFLASDPKNRAENLMIVDLLRNDISRIAKVGSVKVPELFTIETYATVHQMTSLVQAELLDDVTVGDMFQALFPCGSITGAPKIRADGSDPRSGNGSPRYLLRFHRMDGPRRTFIVQRGNPHVIFA